MSKELINRIRKQREIKVPVGAFIFIARRPTVAEAVEISRENLYTEITQRFVVGWENVTENDVAGGGGTDKIEFTAELWREWCADRPEFWSPIANAVLEAYSLYSKQLDGAAKN